MDCQVTVISNRIQRRCLIHLPPHLDERNGFPLLVALHGRLGTGEIMSRQTRFNDVGDREGWVVAYPDGIRRSWADGRGFTHADKKGIDDVKFLERLLDTLRMKWIPNMDKVFLAGYSNGGFLAQRMAVERSNLFAAVAVVSASIPTIVAERFTPERPLSMLFIHGTADTVIPYGGRADDENRGWVSVEEAVTMWAEHNGCRPPDPIRTDRPKDGGCKTCIVSYTSCRNQTRVKLYRLESGGHVWPGGPVRTEMDSGPNDHAIDATEEIRQFFKDTRTPRPDGNV
jgi:polyhydroxybutyrate depolymerase